jgi:hypothetical protein
MRMPYQTRDLRVRPHPSIPRLQPTHTKPVGKVPQHPSIICSLSHHQIYTTQIPQSTLRQLIANFQYSLPDQAYGVRSTALPKLWFPTTTSPRALSPSSVHVKKSNHRHKPSWVLIRNQAARSPSPRPPKVAITHHHHHRHPPSMQHRDKSIWSKYVHTKIAHRWLSQPKSSPFFFPAAKASIKEKRALSIEQLLFPPLANALSYDSASLPPHPRLPPS